ncbi:hypothetical protein [Brevundimonas denitrificans]|uniref:hypothetical protein n=1 Tax=Brevundimonas denitrificans TaxID=1443434 RepID=UPI00223BB5FB|nr:hypothetical protein [Brevundimonas denitrificans]
MGGLFDLLGHGREPGGEAHEIACGDGRGGFSGGGGVVVGGGRFVRLRSGKTVQRGCNVPDSAGRRFRDDKGLLIGGGFGRAAVGARLLHAGLAGGDFLVAGEGLEVLVEAQPAAGLDQPPGGHGGLDVGPGLFDHLDGGEGRGLLIALRRVPGSRLTAVRDHKGVVLRRRRVGFLVHAAPALLAGVAAEGGQAQVVAAADRLGGRTGQIFIAGGGPAAGVSGQGAARDGGNGGHAHPAIVRRPGAAGRKTGV